MVFHDPVLLMSVPAAEVGISKLHFRGSLATGAPNVTWVCQPNIPKKALEGRSGASWDGDTIQLHGLSEAAVTEAPNSGTSRAVEKRYTGHPFWQHEL